LRIVSQTHSFFSAGSHHDTEKTRGVLVTLASTILPGLAVKRLIDRDDRSYAEIETERGKGTLDPMGIPSEIGEDLGGAGERTLGVNHPLALATKPSRPSVSCDCRWNRAKLATA
jgi:hypothetical protein